ncbi:hypothetical protein [Streptococcus suis]|uniref:hypothetical protein n=1 Tax=Streptococcus suis TaxID=1307 RepID=UPI0004112917|nr:hypothetical protein [Streptococcus suis]HEM3181529.1 hypothetical protein [Streptococcus suis 89-5259]
MNVLDTYPLTKYQTDDYNFILFDIYYSKAKKCFSFCCELAEQAEQYPLEDLLEQYWLVCGDYCGEETEIDGTKRFLLEVETIDETKEDFIHILNFSTIIGKNVLNFPVGQFECIGVFCDEVSDFLLNQQEIKLPIYRYRNDRDGMVGFENKHAEAVIIYNHLMKEKSYEFPKAIGMTFDFIYIKDRKAYLVGKQGETDCQLRIGVDGMEELEIIK